MPLLLALKIPALPMFIFRTAEMLYVCQVLLSPLSRFHLEYLASLLVHVAAKCSFGIRGLGVWWLKGAGLWQH